MGAEAVGTGAATGAAAGSVFGPWGTAIGAGIGAVGGGLSWLLGNQAAEEKKKAALEQARRVDAGNRVTMGSAEALASASGTIAAPGTSMAQYLASMGAEFRRENTLNVMSAERGAELEKESNALQFATTVTGSLFKFGQANNWFQSSKTIK